MSSFDVHNLFGVNGKVVLITGGSRGIGKMVRVGSVLVLSSFAVSGSICERLFPLARLPPGS